MTIKYESENSRYVIKFIMAAFLSQVIVFVSLCLLFIIADYPKFIIYSASVIFVFFIVTTYTWMLRSYPEQKINRLIYNVLYVPFFAWQFFAIIAVIPCCLYLLLYTSAQLLSPTYIPQLSFIFQGVLLVLLLLTIYGCFICPKIIKKKHFNLTHNNAPADNYKIAHLSDSHIGNFISKRFLANTAKLINAEKPDLIIITGDLLTFGNHFMDDAIQFITTLTAKDGVIFSLGNHEYYIDTTTLINKLKAIGCIVLCEDIHKINDLTLGAISGITENFPQSSEELNTVLKKNNHIAPDILLAHDSIVFAASKEKNVFLTLSGHTHGGQVALPFLDINAASLFLGNYTSGLYKEDESLLYVNNGLGMSGLPVRTFVHPEIVFFILNKNK